MKFRLDWLLLPGEKDVAACSSGRNKYDDVLPGSLRCLGIRCIFFSKLVLRLLYVLNFYRHRLLGH